MGVALYDSHHVVIVELHAGSEAVAKLWDSSVQRTTGTWRICGHVSSLLSFWL